MAGVSTGLTSDGRAKSLPLMSLTPLSPRVPVKPLTDASLPPQATTESVGDAGQHVRTLSTESYRSSGGEGGETVPGEVYLAAWKGPLTGAISDFTSTLAVGVRRRGTEERSGGDGWRSNSASHVDLTRLNQTAAAETDEDEEDEDEDENARGVRNRPIADHLGLEFRGENGPRSAPIERPSSHRPVIFHDDSETQESHDPDSWHTHSRWTTDPARDDYFAGQSPVAGRSPGRTETHGHGLGSRAVSALSLPLYASQRTNYDDITSKTQPTTPGAYGIGPMSSYFQGGSHQPSPELHFSRRLPKDNHEQEEHDREIERLRHALELSVARGKMCADGVHLSNGHVAQVSGSNPMSKSNSRGHSRRGSSALYPSGSSLSLMTMSQVPSAQTEPRSSSSRMANETPRRQSTHSERQSPPQSIRQETSSRKSNGKDEGLGVWWIDVLHRLFELPLTLAGVEEVGMGPREGLD